MTNVDLLDQRLISLLAKDARQTSGVLAKQLGVNPSTIRRRIQRLIKSGVIRIVALPDYERIGFSFEAVVAFNVVHDKLEEVFERLSNEEVPWVHITTGRYDIIALMRFHSSEDFFNFMRKEVGQIKGIKDTETFVCLPRSTTI